MMYHVLALAIALDQPLPVLHACTLREQLRRFWGTCTDRRAGIAVLTPGVRPEDLLDAAYRALTDDGLLIDLIEVTEGDVKGWAVQVSVAS